MSVHTVYPTYWHGKRFESIPRFVGTPADTPKHLDICEYLWGPKADVWCERGLCDGGLESKSQCSHRTWIKTGRQPTPYG